MSSERMTMQCSGCGYGLDHLASFRCPECGRRYDPGDPETFDTEGQRLRAGRMCLLIAFGCSVYPLVTLAAMITAVVGKIGQVYVVADIAYLLTNVLACGVPFVLVVNLVMLITGPIVARYTRDELWIRWAIATALAGTAWAGWLIIFLFLLPVLII